MYRVETSCNRGDYTPIWIFGLHLSRPSRGVTRLACGAGTDVIYGCVVQRQLSLVSDTARDH